MCIFCFILVFRSMVWCGAVSWVQTNRFSVSSDSLQFKYQLYNQNRTERLQYTVGISEHV